MHPDLSSRAGFERAALARITLTYLWCHRRLPDLVDPSLFTELIQLRKLHDRDRRMPFLADKVSVKTFVSERLGREWVIPTLWSGKRLPSRSHWRQPVVVKSRHGCNQNAFVYDDAPKWRSVEARSARWMTRAYGGWLDEWLYQQIPRGLLIEPFVGQGRDLPLDYKFYVFGGRVTHVQVHLDRAGDHRWVVLDTNWRAVSSEAPTIPRPSALSAMIAAAEDLARDFSFARVDFYQPGAQPLFGEISFYPGSGLDPFDPPSLDAEMGQSWLRSGGSLLVAAAREEGLATRSRQNAFARLIPVRRDNGSA